MNDNYALKKEDVYLILGKIVSDMRVEVSDELDVERHYAFIAGLQTMANEVIDIIEANRMADDRGAEK